MQDLPLDTNQNGPAPDTEWDAVPFRPEVAQVSSMEAEWHVLEGAGLSEAIITTDLPATCQSSRSGYDARWDAFCSWCGEWEVDPIRAPLNLEFQQLQSQSKAVNTMKGYMNTISNRHVRINDSPLSTNPMVHSWSHENQGILQSPDPSLGPPDSTEGSEGVPL